MCSGSVLVGPGSLRLGPVRDRFLRHLARPIHRRWCPTNEALTQGEDSMFVPSYKKSVLFAVVVVAGAMTLILAGRLLPVHP
jgi:hypothetical protein